MSSEKPSGESGKPSSAKPESADLKLTPEEKDRMFKEVAKIVELNREQCPVQHPQTPEEEEIRRMA